MTAVFGLVFFISIPALLLGLIRPSVYSRFLKANATRKKIALIFGGVMFVSFIGIAATVPPTDDVQGIADESDAEVQPDAQETVNGEETVDSNPVEVLEDANLGQEDDQTAEPSSVTNDPGDDAQGDSGSSSEDTGTTESTEPDGAVSSNDSGGEEAAVETGSDPSASSPSEDADATAQNPSVATCSCPSSDLDCGDFATHSEAQEVYECCMEQVGYDVHQLDGSDNDGLACESRP